MHYTIYKTTNLINGKYYIGKHQTEDLDDGYLGSGNLIKKAIAKYGIENFKKEILFVFDNEQEMNDKEKELVVVSEETYNLCPGGQGGFGYINNNKLTGCTFAKRSKEYVLRVSGKGRNIALQKFKSDPEFLAKSKAKSANTWKKKLQNGYVMHFTGKKHSEETKISMSQSRSGKGTGRDNSQFGSFWITNGSVSKKVKNTDDIPEGWKRGRVISR